MMVMMMMMTENESDGVFIIFRGLKKIIGRKLSCHYISKSSTYHAILYNSQIIEINDHKILIS
jgi:hypothetical protein